MDIKKQSKLLTGFGLLVIILFSLGGSSCKPESPVAVQDISFELPYTVSPKTAWCMWAILVFIFLFKM